MVRRLFNAASAVSLLLCAATAVLWERSYRHSDGFSFWTSRGFLELASRRGDFVLDNQPQQELDRQWLWRINRRMDALAQRSRELSGSIQQANDRWKRAPDRFEKGGAAGAAAEMGTAEVDVIRAEEQIMSLRWIERRFAPKWPTTPGFAHSIPCDAVFAATSALPAAWLLLAFRATRRQRFRRKNGLCPSCGYNLSGNTSGTCPECGTPIAMIGPQAVARNAAGQRPSHKAPSRLRIH